MTLRNSSPQWTWNDDTEACVSRLFAGIYSVPGGQRGNVIKHMVNQALAELGSKSDLNQVAAAVADHMPP